MLYRRITRRIVAVFTACVIANLSAAAQDQPAKRPADADDFANLVDAIVNDPANADATLKQLMQDGDTDPARKRVADILATNLDLSPETSAAFAPDAIEFFERAVRPVLAENCYGCHGAEKQKSGLRLDARESILKGGSAGPAIEPGKPENSRLIQAIRRQGDLAMPPENPLSEDAVDALTQWVRLGAPWPDEAPPRSALTFEEQVAVAKKNHWAFQPIANPEAPAVDGGDWVKNPIDAFVLKRLEDADLSPSPRAGARTLIRRAAYGLLGLPPEMETVRKFEADPSPEAFSQVIDAYLASPRYGERWGRYWLDVARYADTKGYVFQEERAFPYSHTYRDYVIDAFNQDKPYDQFILEQLAADKLELGDNKEPLAAMGFLTVGRRFINNIHDITDDRIDVVTRGFLGLTVTCARCHEHKYDPISDKDYYALYGVFRSSVEPGELPLIEEPDPDDPQYQDYLAKVEEKQKEIDAFLDKNHSEWLVHAREKAGAYLKAGFDVQGEQNRDAVQTLAKDRDLTWQLVEKWRDYLAKKIEAGGPVFEPLKAFAALPPEEFETKAPELAKRFAENKDNAINPYIAKALQGDPPKSMSDVIERYGKVLAKADKAWTDRLAAEVGKAQQAGEGSVEIPAALEDGNLEAIRLVLYADDSPASIKANEIEGLNDIPTRDRIRNLRNARERVKATHPGRPGRAMILTDSGNLFDPYVFQRGKPGSRGDDVPRRNLVLLASNGEPEVYKETSGRLELAKSIASEDNPLTARVLVNRVWMYHFGKPLVDTPSDFGLRSEHPTHPELLDYLATWFMENGWSIKKLHKLIMTSNAYQQSSEARVAARKIDPENKLVWRQNRQRLDFEAMRDTLLAVTGNLDLTMGGPSVDITSKPYPPRRTVYAHIERQNLPAMFRTFDFASPDTHSPRRYLTTVPQQALFLMNSDFVAQQARALTSRTVDESRELDANVAALYEDVFQRAPKDEEIQLAKRFMDRIGSAAPMPEPVWRYGYGTIDPNNGTVTTFKSLPHFTGSAYQGGPDLPDKELGWTSLNARGGHPGGSADFVPIRRWVAPSTCTVRIRGEFSHNSDKGDGVHGLVIHNGTNLIWKGHAHNGKTESSADEIQVAQGDTIDFAVFCGANESFDSFGWTPRVVRSDGPETRWQAAEDFDGPGPEPLNPWQRYAQVLLLTNELMFVD